MAGDEPTLKDDIRKLGFADAESDGFVEAFSGLTKVIELSPGTLLFSEGEMHDKIYFVCEGTVSLEMLTAKCGKQRILTIGPGELLAWSGLLGDGRMTSTAITLESSRMIELDVVALKGLCESDHEFGYTMMTRIAQALSRRLLATRLQLLDLYHAEAG